MFILHRASKTENLLAALITIIEETPLSSAFKKESLLVQHPGMERWLSQQLARQFKVWGNYQFLTPNRFFNAIAQKINPPLTDTRVNQDAMVWQLENLLRDTLDNEHLTPVKHYLTGDNSPLKRYQLAHKLAQLFERYQLLRPDMLTAWQHNQLLYHTETERWQKILWQQINTMPTQTNKAALWLEVIATLNSTDEGALARHLPERLCIFGVNQLSPLMLDFLHGLARHCQVHFFWLSPLSNKTTQTQPVPNTQHSLLASLAQQAYELQNMLTARGLFKNSIEHLTDSEKPATVLQQLHADILRPPQPPKTLIKDASISIHACHSRLREVEVLRNQLLLALERDTNLELRDIIVMSPDSQHYAPFISAIFNDIQHTIADCPTLLSHHVINAFIDFLQLSQSRFGWQSVLDLLERPFIFASFDLTDDAVDLIKHWLQATRVRWGKSAAHKQELDLFACEENTWQALLNRLLMGYAIGDDSEFVDAILPYKDIEGSSAQALGGLHDFLQLLFNASTQFKAPMLLTDWGTVLYSYAETLLVAADPIEREQLNSLLLALSSPLNNPHNQTVELAVIIAWLQDQANEPLQHDAGGGFLRGQLTFCALQPMRAIPFKIIALLGMNESDFPRLDQQPTFDLTTQETRKGDSSKRNDDRYQFLEILLSVRQQLIISYVGQSIKHNNRIAPSIVVSELLDVLRDSYQLTDIITYHPLHAFSAQYFKGNSDLLSFSQADCDTARALAQPKIEPSVWWQGVLSEPEETIIEVFDVLRFFQHPQRYFMQRQLLVRLFGLSADAQEREAFSLDKLETYATLNQGIEDSLKGVPMSVKKLQAQGRWLSGVMGDLAAESQATVISDFVLRINTLNLGEKIHDVPLDITVGRYRLVGTLGHCYKNGSLFYRYTALKGKDFICAVLHHLMINQQQPHTTYLLSSDEHIVLLPEHCQDDYLLTLLDSYQQGQQRPNAFFSEAALAYIQQASKSGAAADGVALNKASAQLVKAINQPYELELKRLFGAATVLESILGEDFEWLCQSTLLPLWQATHSAD